MTPDPMLPEPWRVYGLRRETRDTFTLKLEPLRPRDRFSFAAGQFNMIYVFGIGEIPVSMSSHDKRAGRLVHTVRGVGAVSRAITRLEPGFTVGIRGPFGSGWPLAEAAGGDVVIIAGGIGMAPLRPALEELQWNRRAYRRVALLYGARRPGDLLYVKELRRWGERFDAQVELTVDSAAGDWQFHVGVVTALLPKVDFEPQRTTALVCGPEIMMRFAVRELRHGGVGEDRVFVSLERNMKCAVGFCGHCQFGPSFICKDGPVFCYGRIRHWFETREI